VNEFSPVTVMGVPVALKPLVAPEIVTRSPLAKPWGLVVVTVAVVPMRVIDWIGKALNRRVRSVSPRIAEAARMLPPPPGWKRLPGVLLSW
jgi:hypothetical protein